MAPTPQDERGAPGGLVLLDVLEQLPRGAPTEAGLEPAAGLDRHVRDLAGAHRQGVGPERLARVIAEDERRAVARELHAHDDEGRVLDVDGNVERAHLEEVTGGVAPEVLSQVLENARMGDLPVVGEPETVAVDAQARELGRAWRGAAHENAAAQKVTAP